MAIYQGRYYSSSYNLERDLKEIEKNFDVASLDYYINSAQDDIKDLQEGIKRCQERISHLIWQRQFAESIKYKYIAYCSRHAWGSPVYYFTGVYKIPAVPNGKDHKITLESHKWVGKERSQAIKAAKELAKKYKCELELSINAKR